MANEDQPWREGPTCDAALGQVQFGGFGLITQIEQQSLTRRCARKGAVSSRRSAEEPAHGLPLGLLDRIRGQSSSLYAPELTARRTNRVSRPLSFLRKEIGHRKVAFARVVIEGQNALALKLRKLLFDPGQRRPGRDADQQALLACSASSH